ncbi:MAG: hypothetical protein Q7S33_03595 [Nanoarchaeota archaeon]|nr:hypothetical protein [Nanoarchaeota archaeon]
MKNRRFNKPQNKNSIPLKGKFSSYGIIIIGLIFLIVSISFPDVKPQYGRIIGILAGVYCLYLGIKGIRKPEPNPQQVIKPQRNVIRVKSGFFPLIVGLLFLVVGIFVTTGISPQNIFWRIICLVTGLFMIYIGIKAIIQ